MMEETSVTAIEYDHALRSETDVTVERLEFGKFCVSADGPIESNRENIPIEHSQLGWSIGFPEDLIPACYPTKLGIVQEDGETLPRDNFHGTVLRPVVLGPQKRVRQVFYRVRARAEEGEGKSGRRYTLARYLAVPVQQVDPLTMLTAMDSVQLKGITRAAARHIPPIDSEPKTLELDGMGEAFLREALIYILSGVALSITEYIPEATFFSLVAAVHDHLPLALRPHLSAGWNVGSSYSGKLGITFTTHRAASTALFSPKTLTWLAPDYVTTWNAQHEPVTNSFFKERLEPGRLFERYVCKEAGLGESPSERLSSLAGSLPPADFPEVPGFDDPGTVRIFRYPGLQARDQFTLRALTEWLEKGTDEESARGSLDARELIYQTNRLQALKLIVQALSKSASRRRADRALWASLNEKVPTSFTNLLEGATGVGAKRARLMAAIAGGDVFRTLSALQSTPPEECDDLPENVTTRLLEILDRSLQMPIDRGVMSYHSRLLLFPAAPYSRWVKRHSLELMTVFAAQEETPTEALTAIVQISDSHAIRALQYFLTNEALNPTVESVLRCLQPEERHVFIEVLNRRWEQRDESTSLRREALLNWFRVLQPQNSPHALLKLVSGAQLTDSDVREIADDVESCYVPESLLPAVAELALQRWPIVGRRISSESRHVLWLAITNLWPSTYAAVLGRGKGTDRPDPKIQHIAQHLRLGYAELEYLLTIWFPYDRFKQAAPLLWEWAIKLEPRSELSPTAFDLCRPFIAGRLPDCKLSKQVFDDFVKLVRESERGNIPTKVLQEMWRFASRVWQVKLLLILFPQENLEPTLAQLSLLIPHRKWLNQHLHDPETRFDRRGFFGIATEPFHSLSFRDSAWRDEFIQCPLWAAFRGVPISTLPPRALRKALRAYTGSDDLLRTGEQPAQVIQEQAGLCLTFLRSYEGAASQDGAMKRVLLDFVLPFYRYRWSRERFRAAVASVGVDMKLPGYERTDKYKDRFSPSMYELISQILNLCDRKSLLYIIKEFYKH